MANTPVHVEHRSPGLDDGIATQLTGFQNRFLQEYRRVLQEAGMPPRLSVFQQPHDSMVVVDKTHVTILACRGSANSTSSSDHYVDLSSEGSLSAQQLIRTIGTEMGWEEVECAQFARSVLVSTPDLRDEEFREVADRAVTELHKKKEIAVALGITDALDYLANAKARFEVGGSAASSDCKANCRNALVSLLRGLAGTEDVRAAVKALRRGVFWVNANRRWWKP